MLFIFFTFAFPIFTYLLLGQPDVCPSLQGQALIAGFSVFWAFVLCESGALVSKQSCCCSAAKSCPTLCDPMNCSTPGFLVQYYLPEFAQIHVH